MADGLRTYRILLTGLVGVALAGAALRLLSSTSPIGAYECWLPGPTPSSSSLGRARARRAGARRRSRRRSSSSPCGSRTCCGRPRRRRSAGSARCPSRSKSWMLLSVAVLDSSPFGLGWTHLRNLVAVIPLFVVVGVVWVRQGNAASRTRRRRSGLRWPSPRAGAVREGDLVHKGRFDAPSFLPWSAVASPDAPG